VRTTAGAWGSWGRTGAAWCSVGPVESDGIC
jgi:hypothetical protein